MSTLQFAALVLAHDPVTLSRAACAIEHVAANDDNWQVELDNDPDYLRWLDGQAEIENMRHARW